MSGRRWREDEIEALRRAVSAGLSSRQISALLPGRSRHAVRSKMTELGLGLSPEQLRAAYLAALPARGKVKRRKGIRPSAETVAKRAETMRRIWQEMPPERRAAWRANIATARKPITIGAAVREAKMGWCPPPFRAEYYRLTRTKCIPAGEAREMLMPMIADWLRSFEGQMWRVSKGKARVVEKAPTRPPQGYVASELAGAMT